MFQSTYLYKVRRHCTIFYSIIIEFQSTYLYKVRLHVSVRDRNVTMFQSTYLYKIRRIVNVSIKRFKCFNPRTSIRYDRITNNTNIYSLLPISLCDNKLFGFFIDEIEPIDMCNRLTINKCENPGFLLMLNVREQLYYKFVFYIIRCDDTYVFNPFRIIISQEIETDTIFFMIYDIR